MDFFDILQERYSVRSFKSQVIEEEKIKALLEAANSAPSAGNLQAFRIYMITNKDIKSRLVWAALSQSYIEEAPVCFVFCAYPQKSAQKYGRRGAELYAIQDATIAAVFLHLAAVDLELGSVWVGAFHEKEVQKVLSLPKELKPIILLPCGYPNEIPYKTPRIPIEKLVTEIK